MFNQIGWEQFSVARHPTYQNPTLVFLSSFNYYLDQRVGRDKGLFRLFGPDYHFSHNEICELLGFKISHDAFTKVPRDNFIQYELDNL